MKIKKIPFTNVPQLSSKDVSYITEIPALRPFYKYPVQIDSFAGVIKDKNKEKQNREQLVEIITHQYTKLSASPQTIDNITALSKTNTFTIVTAHQPSLFTGPLYYVIKIASTLNLANQLNQHYPSHHFVPVFITGGEDHDFDEINHIHLFGKKLEWQNDETGAVGAMKTTTLAPVLEELKTILGNSDNARLIFEKLSKAYTGNEYYADAAIEFTHELFKKYGLVIINMADPRLKKLFAPIIKEEILRQPSHGLVEATTRALEAAGFKQQAFPREINFFYLGDQFRERIVEENGQFKVLNTDLSFSAKALEKEIENHPERFSPNVIMRPIYEEYLLPNLAYIGGGGELAYWMERKSQFEHFGINFPMLIRRNSMLWIDKGTMKRMQKFGFEILQLFEDTEMLLKEFVRSQANGKLNFSREKSELKEIFTKVLHTTKKIDPTLEKTVLAEQAKQIKSLEILESKVMRAEKQKHDIALNQIRSLKEKLFPNNGLQERYDNFLGFYLKYGETFIDTLVENLNPLEKEFFVFYEE